VQHTVVILLLQRYRCTTVGASAPASRSIREHSETYGGRVVSVALQVVSVCTTEAVDTLLAGRRCGASGDPPVVADGCPVRQTACVADSCIVSLAKGAHTCITSCERALPHANVHHVAHHYSNPVQCVHSGTMDYVRPKCAAVGYGRFRQSPGLLLQLVSCIEQ
jgi:hypothetical protein